MIWASYVGKGTFLKPAVISGYTHNGLYLASGAKFLNSSRHSSFENKSNSLAKPVGQRPINISNKTSQP